MSQPYVCAACRHHAQSRDHIRRALFSIAFSQPATRSQYVSYAWPERTARTAVQGKRDYATATDTAFPVNRLKLPPKIELPSRGRYSRRELRPETLLDELKDVKNSGPKRAPRLGEHVGPDQKEAIVAEGEFSQFSRDIRNKLRHLSIISRRPEKDEEFWITVQDLIQLTEQDKSLRHEIGKAASFQLWYAQFLKRRCDIEVLLTRAPLPGGTPMPQPYHAFRTLLRFGAHAEISWRQILWQMVASLLKYRGRLRQGRPNSADDRSTEGTELSIIEGAIRELMKVWNICLSVRLQPQRTLDLADSASLDWSYLPDSHAFMASLQQDRGTLSVGFADALDMLAPAVSNVDGDRLSLLQNAALTTLDLLQTTTASATLVREEGSKISLAALPVFAPFANLIEALLRIKPTEFTPPQLRRLPRNQEEAATREELEAVARRMGLRVPRFRISNPAEERPAESQPLIAGSSSLTNSPRVQLNDGKPDILLDSAVESQDKETDHFVNLRINRLGQALQKSSIPLAESIAHEVLDFSSKYPEKMLPNQLYEHLMLTLLKLRKPKSASVVWKHFVGSKHKATVKTYTVMMLGAQHVRDVEGMEGFWRSLRAARLHPDKHAWSVRIYGLLKAGRVDAGLQALMEMSHEWVAAARSKYLIEHPASVRHQKKSKSGATTTPEVPSSLLLATYPGDVDGVARPTLEVMNATISALVGRHSEHIPKALTWGRAYGLEPDQITYNVLLNLSMREERADEAIGILKRMQDRGIETNSETWTVLLNALFKGGSLEQLSPAEQQFKILNFISGFETASRGPGVDAKGYAIVIDRLLKLYNNPVAAQAVLEHMTARGLAPTAHIYTILMASYFSPAPGMEPDFGAIESLWSQIQARDSGRGARLDDLFYDRMVEGYASHHRSVGAEPMLQFLALMGKAGRKASWRSLELVARALADRGDWSTLAGIVDDVRGWQRQAGDGEVGDRGGIHGAGQREYGQTAFWEFILETGLLREEGVTKVEQVIGRGKAESVLSAAAAASKA